MGAGPPNKQEASELVSIRRFSKSEYFKTNKNFEVGRGDEVRF